jgi:hypothetical protein
VRLRQGLVSMMVVKLLLVIVFEVAQVMFTVWVIEGARLE